MKFFSNEIKLIGKYKLVFLILLSFISTFFYYNKVIVEEYQNYYKNMQIELENVDTNLKAIDIYLNTQVNDINARIDKTKDKKIIENLENERDKAYELKEKFGKLKANVSLISFYRGDDLKSLDKYWEETDKFIKENFMDQMVKNKEEIPIDGYAITNDLDWSNRVIEREYLKDKKINMAKDKPYGLFVLKDFLSLNFITINLIFLIILLISGNIWSQDFEENEGKIILSLPFSKKKFYAKRFLLSLGIILLPIIVFSIYSGIRYGFNPNGPIIVNSYLNENIFLNTSIDRLTQYDYLNIHMPISVIKYSLYQIIYLIFYILLLYSMVNFFNIFTKNTILTAGFIFLLVFISVRSTSVSIYNLLSYYNIKDILYGFILEGPYNYEIIRYGYGAFLLIMGLVSLVLYVSGMLIFDKQ